MTTHPYSIVKLLHLTRYGIGVKLVTPEQHVTPEQFATAQELVSNKSVTTFQSFQRKFVLQQSLASSASMMSDIDSMPSHHLLHWY